MSSGLLLPEERELLDTLVGAYKAFLPERQQFFVYRTLKGDSVAHPGLPGGEIPVYMGDVDALAEANCIRLTSRTGAITQFDLTSTSLRIGAGDRARVEQPLAPAAPGKPRVVWALIASPSDVAAERAAVVEALERFSSSIGRINGILVHPLRWETAASPQFGQEPQTTINEDLVDTADLLIGVFWTRLGTPTLGSPSGTANEIARCVSQGKPVLLYFSDREVAPSQMEGSQLDALKSFRESIRSRALYGTFENRHHLQLLLMQDLSNRLLTLPLTRPDYVEGGQPPLKAPLREYSLDDLADWTGAARNARPAL